MNAAAPSAALFDPAEHRPLSRPTWSDQAVRDAIAEIAADAIAAYRGPEQLWPNHPADRDDGDEDRPFRCVYLGAAGMAWGLQRLARAGVAPELPGLAELGESLPVEYRADPELIKLETGAPPPPPSLLFGESGILITCEAIGRSDPCRQDALAEVIAANTRNPTCDLCWGSPGTMIAAEAMWRATAEERWRELWRESAEWLISEWEDPVWTQDMYGERCRYVGAGHGFASNASVLLSGLDLLADDEDAHGRPGLIDRIITTTSDLAVQEDVFAQWPGLADLTIDRRPVQWCHGAPGIVTALARLPREPHSDALLAAGGELTWRAGPLRKGVGICHGTAGNGYALLALHHRTGNEMWLERARAFAAEAAADVQRRRRRHGGGRYTLFTGDLGVALLLAACLAPDPDEPDFPFLDRPLG
jgi:lanthionine synthetase-like protein